MTPILGYALVDSSTDRVLHLFEPSARLIAKIEREDRNRTQRWAREAEAFVIYTLLRGEQVA